MFVKLKKNVHFYFQGAEKVRESSLCYNAPSTIHKHIVSIRRKILLPITPPH